MILIYFSNWSNLYINYSISNDKIIKHFEEILDKVKVDRAQIEADISKI